VAYMELLEKNTFGSTKASEVLVALVNELGDKKVARTVSKLVISQSVGLHNIRRGFVGPGFRDTLMSLWNDFCDNRVQKSNLPDKMKSYIRNIGKTTWKKIRRGDYGDPVWKPKEKDVDLCDLLETDVVEFFK